MIQELENMKTSLCNIAKIAEDQRNTIELYKTIIYDRDNRIRELSDQLNQRDIENESLRVDFFNCEEALKEQQEVSEVLREKVKAQRRTLEELYKERDALKMLVKSYKEFLAFKAEKRAAE